LRFDRMSGLDSAQLDELEQMVSELLEEPWDKGEGRPRELNLREALIVTCGYLRQNIIEDVWAEIFDVAQSTISRYITFLTPLVEKATDEGRPTAADAVEATRGAIALVDGTLWPCWSWDGERELWSGKYKTTGHGSLIVTNLQGRITFVSEPVTGNKHDMAKLKGSAVEKILKAAGGVFQGS
jgi:Helix-turn-helix of DDE superfamily endonuclease